MSLINRQIANRIISSQTRREELSRARQSLSDPTKLSDRQVIEAWAVIGECHMYDKKPKLAEEAYLRAIEITKTLGDVELLGEAYTDLGHALYFCGDHPKAITYYRQAAEIFDQLNETEELITTLSQMAYAFAMIGRRDEERECLEEAIHQPHIHPQTKATLVERVALSLGAAGQYEAAIETYEKALALYEAEDFKRYWGQRLVNLAQFYEAIGDIEAARKTMERL